MNTEQLTECVVQALDDLKAKNVNILDVREFSSVTDVMVIAEGGSNRHVKAIANSVIEAAKAQGERPLGVEGENNAEWILVDLGDVIVHVMQTEVRNFYQLDKLWQASPKTEKAEITE